MREKFKKLGTAAVVMLLCISALSVFASAAAPEESNFPSGAVPVSVSLEGKTILEGESVIINSTTYVPLRKFATEAGADNISWNDKTKTATVQYEGRTVYIPDGGNYIHSEGRYFYTPEKILNINGSLFVPIRPISSALSIDVTWNGSKIRVSLEKSKKAFVSGNNFYNQDDLYWLSRIISSESRGEPLSGKIAVGNVVLNRKAHKSYPNTVYGVIFDRVGGTQFSPVAIGTIYQKPTEESIIAAKICLEGYSISNKILFFMNPTIATNNWISNNRPFAFTIGNHKFYY